MKKFFTFILLTFLLSTTAYSQIEDRFGQLLNSEISNYAKPFATSLGLILNTPGYHSASVSKTFGFSISIIGMYLFIPDDQLTFTPSLPDGYVSGSTATIFGDKGGAFAGPNGFMVYPAGVNESSIPGLVPQISASFMGTEVMLRYVPKITMGETDFNFYGFGLKHSFGQYIPALPLDVAVQFVYNSLTLTDILDVTSYALNAHASKTFGVFTLYGGLQYESTSMDISYTFKDPNNLDPTNKGLKLNASMDGDNSFRVTLGGALKIAVLVLNVDYNLASQSMVTSGISFEF